MQLRNRVQRLERRLQPSRTCPVCGQPPGMLRTAILFECPQDGLTKTPPDPRPTCPACQLPEGGIALLWAEAEDLGEASSGELDRDGGP